MCVSPHVYLLTPHIYPCTIPTYTHTHIHIHTCTHTSTYTHAHIYMHTHVHTCTHTYTHTYTCTHNTCIHTCTLTYTYKHIKWLHTLFIHFLNSLLHPFSSFQCTVSTGSTFCTGWSVSFPIFASVVIVGPRPDSDCSYRCSGFNNQHSFCQ